MKIGLPGPNPFPIAVFPRQPPRARAPNCTQIMLSPDFCIDLPYHLIPPELQKISDFWRGEMRRLYDYRFHFVSGDREKQKEWQTWYSLFKEKRGDPDEVAALLAMVPIHPCQDFINQHVDFTNAPPGCKPAEEAK